MPEIEIPVAEPLSKKLILVRHGEAVHNSIEKKIKQTVAKEIKELGIEPLSPKHTSMVKQRRASLLADPNLLDPGLSDLGNDQAIEAREALNVMVRDGRLPAPERVLVSPLLRTLQTGAAMFPQHPNVHVHESIRERRTGLPCDERSPMNYPSHSPILCHMHLTGIEIDEETASTSASCSDNGSLEFENSDFDSPGLPDFMMVKKPSMSDLPCSPTGKEEIEDAPMLRERALQLATLLESVPEEIICVVSHKGYLRELERGLLQKPDAGEFGNCEVRVYDVGLDGNGGVNSATLCCCLNAES
jgi:broad specificity phosphatase PhoE